MVYIIFYFCVLFTNHSTPTLGLGEIDCAAPGGAPPPWSQSKIKKLKKIITNPEQIKIIQKKPTKANHKY